MNGTHNPPRIVIAAVRRGGITFTGLRHGHIIRDMVECGFLTDIKKPVLSHEQGFVDSTGRFVNREYAAELAKANNQVPQDHGTLYSEDLW